MDPKIVKLENDIKSIKIQGATNVALATIEGMKIAVKHVINEPDRIIPIIKKVGERLSLARNNEPLARNGVKYVLYMSKKVKLDDLPSEIIDICSSYQVLIQNAKRDIINFGTDVLKKEEVILTHCHSSTAVSILKNIAKFRSIKGEKFKVISTETRPLYQGRLTAKELFNSGIEVTQIVDSFSTSFIVEDKYIPIGAVIVGCDELLKDGSFINKVGTYAIALASKKDNDKFYVAVSLLKLEVQENTSLQGIEQREASEVWKDAPKGMKIINPAFEKIDSSYVTGYITEAGELKKQDILKTARKIYPWLFDSI